MSFSYNKLNEIGVELGSITVINDYFLNFQGSKELLAK